MVVFVLYLCCVCIVAVSVFLSTNLTENLISTDPHYWHNQNERRLISMHVIVPRGVYNSWSMFSIFTKRYPVCDRVYILNISIRSTDMVLSTQRVCVLWNSDLDSTSLKFMLMSGCKRFLILLSAFSCTRYNTTFCVNRLQQFCMYWHSTGM